MIKPWHRTDRLLFGTYCVWIAIGIAAAALRIDDLAVGGWPLPSWLAAFVSACFLYGDPVLILLAAANTHLLLVRFWGLRTARWWFAKVVLISATVEICGTMTGWPFGHYAYTGSFGPRIFLLPVAIPLAWYVLVSNALVLWRSLLAGFVIPIEAAVAATIVTAIDWVMEPFATKLKAYWLWDGPIPARNYEAWWVIAFLLILFFAKRPGYQDKFDIRPLVILGTMVALFAVSRVLAGI